MKRLNWLISNLGSKLADKLSDEGLTFLAQNAVTHFSEFDPTSNKRMTYWLIGTYLNDGFLFEDLSKAHETLELFEKVQPHLDIEDRDLNQHKSLGELWKRIKEFSVDEDEDFSPSGKERKRREKAEAYENSIIVVDEDDLTVAIPLTVEAAQWWGRGTRWCTSATKDNAFHSYNQKAPLIVINLHDEGKLQLWPNTNRYQFMNADDAAVEISCVKANWDRIGEIVLWAAERSPSLIKVIPAQHITQELAKKALEADFIDNLDYIPKRFHKPEFFFDVNIDISHWIRKIDKTSFTPDFCRKIVSDSPHIIDLIPPEFLTPELCEISVSKAGINLRGVPLKMRTRELCELAIQGTPDVLYHIPDKYRTTSMLEDVISINGMSLGLVPEDKRTKRLCMLALSNAPFALRFVPEKLKTESLCEKLFEVEPRVYDDLPIELKTLERSIELVTKYPSYINTIRKKHVTAGLFLDALRRDPSLASCVPKKYKTNEFYMTALQDTYLQAVKSNVRNINYVPRDEVTEELVIAVLESGPEGRHHLPCFSYIYNDPRFREILSRYPLPVTAETPAITHNWKLDSNMMNEIHELSDLIAAKYHSPNMGM